MQKKIAQLLSSVVLVVCFFILAGSNPAMVSAQDMCCRSGFTLADGSIGASFACGVNNDNNPGQCCSNWLADNELEPAFDCDLNGVPLSCEWGPLNNIQSQYHGKPAFCVGGFVSQQHAQSHTLRFTCVSNCGGVLDQAINNAFRAQTYSLSNAEIGTDGNNLYTCVTGDLDTNAINAVQGVLRGQQWAGCGAAGAVTVANVVGGFLTGGATFVLQPTLIAATAATCGATLATTAQTLLTPLLPTYRAEVVNSSGAVTCAANLAITSEIVVQQENANTEPSVPFNLCAQIPDAALKGHCTSCLSSSGVWTALGCINFQNNGANIIKTLITLGLSLGGGFTLLIILFAGFTLSTSQGDPKRVSEAKELITSAVIGLLFIIFSVTILQFIGVSLFRIPGFGS